MFSVVDIVRRDAATYYAYSTNKRVSRLRTVFGFAFIGLGIGFLVVRASNEFLGGALSAQAILVGFSFNVLFYLVANRLSIPTKFQSLEHELRFKRLSKLSDEVFDNVMYFSLVAITSALAALVLLLCGSNHFNANIHKIGIWLQRHTAITADALSWIKWGGFSLALATLTFLLIESVYTFLRAVGRVRFYFTMLRTMDDENRS